MKLGKLDGDIPGETQGYKRCGNSLAQSLDPRSIQTSLREIVRVGCEDDEWKRSYNVYEK